MDKEASSRSFGSQEANSLLEADPVESSSFRRLNDYSRDAEGKTNRIEGAG